MRTLLMLCLIAFIALAGCSGGGQSLLVIDRVSPNESVIRSDRLRMAIQGVEDPSMLTILVNDQIVTPEVVYFADTWVVVFTAAPELKIGDNNVITVVEDDRQDSTNLVVRASRPPLETSPFVVFVSPEDRKVNPNEAVKITMDNLVGKTVDVGMVELGGRYTDLTPVSTTSGNIINFDMPPFEGAKLLLMISVEGAEIFDYIELSR